jgi:hypothetical protein
MVSVNESFNQPINVICVLFLFICVFHDYIDLFIGLYAVFLPSQYVKTFRCKDCT